jgi:hypothetical protein
MRSFEEKFFSFYSCFLGYLGWNVLLLNISLFSAGCLVSIHTNIPLFTTTKPFINETWEHLHWLEVDLSRLYLLFRWSTFNAMVHSSLHRVISCSWQRMAEVYGKCSRPQQRLGGSLAHVGTFTLQRMPTGSRASAFFLSRKDTVQHQLCQWASLRVYELERTMLSV